MLGVKLKKLRTKKGVTQETLAKALGVSAQAVSKWEQNITSPDISLLVPIVDFFGVNLDFLLRDGPNEEITNANEIVEVEVEPAEYCWLTHVKNISGQEIKELILKAYFYDENNEVVEYCTRRVYDLEPGMSFPLRLFATDEQKVTNVSVTLKKCVFRH